MFFLLSSMKQMEAIVVSNEESSWLLRQEDDLGVFLGRYSLSEDGVTIVREKQTYLPNDDPEDGCPEKVVIRDSRMAFQPGIENSWIESLHCTEKLEISYLSGMFNISTETVVDIESVPFEDYPDLKIWDQERKYLLAERENYLAAEIEPGLSMPKGELSENEIAPLHKT